MGTKMESPKTEIQKVRITPELREECRILREAGSWSKKTEGAFFEYLIQLGIVRYEKLILPVERGDDMDQPQLKQRCASNE